MRRCRRWEPRGIVEHHAKLQEPPYDQSEELGSCLLPLHFDNALSLMNTSGNKKPFYCFRQEFGQQRKVYKTEKDVIYPNAKELSKAGEEVSHSLLNHPSDFIY